MDPGRALASLRALKSQPIPLARTAVEPRPVVAQRRSPHAARLQQKRANSGVLCPPLPPDELVSPRGRVPRGCKGPRGTSSRQWERLHDIACADE